MSFGGPEDSSEPATDFHFTTPAGHAGVSFFAATGDTGSYDQNGTHATSGSPPGWGVNAACWVGHKGGACTN